MPSQIYSLNEIRACHTRFKRYTAIENGGVMNFCWSTIALPELWQMARIVAVYNGEGATTLPKSYRLIALLLAVHKIFTSLIERRLRALEPRLWKMQQCYRWGRSIDAANHLFLRAVELALRWQDLHRYLLFLDWKKCYDRIHHDRLLYALRRFGLPENYL